MGWLEGPSDGLPVGREEGLCVGAGVGWGVVITGSEEIFSDSSPIMLYFAALDASVDAKVPETIEVTNAHAKASSTWLVDEESI